MKDVAHNFSKASAYYDQNASIQKSIANTLVNISRDYTHKPQPLILDCGAATGQIRNILQMDTYDLDISESMCIRNSNSLSVTADMTQIPFSSNSFDYVFSSMALQWVEQPKLFFTECFRVLKTGGIAFISTVLKDSLYELKQAQIKVSGHSKVIDFVTPEMLIEASESSGLTTLDSDIKNYIQNFADLRSLMKSITSIGASNYQAQQKKYMGKSTLTDIMLHYPCKLGSNELPIYSITWNIGYFVLTKEV